MKSYILVIWIQSQFKCDHWLRHEQQTLLLLITGNLFVKFFLPTMDIGKLSF